MRNPRSWHRSLSHDQTVTTALEHIAPLPMSDWREISRRRTRFGGGGITQADQDPLNHGKASVTPKVTTVVAQGLGFLLCGCTMETLVVPLSRGEAQCGAARTGSPGSPSKSGLV